MTQTQLAEYKKIKAELCGVLHVLWTVRLIHRQRGGQQNPSQGALEEGCE